MIIIQNKENVLTVDSAVAGYCSYQSQPFSASDPVEKLVPKFDMTPAIGLLIATVINQEQHRYNYGRKASQSRLRKAKIKLPVSYSGKPDWSLMEDYIKTLPYSSKVTLYKESEK